MKLRIDAVGIDGGRDQFARRDLERARGDLEQGISDHLRQFLRVALDDGRDQRLLAREVLVERTDADAGHGRNFVGARPIVAFLDQNASSRFEKRFDGEAGPLLRGRLSGICLRSPGHAHRPGMRVPSIVSDRLYSVHAVNGGGA